MISKNTIIFINNNKNKLNSNFDFLIFTGLKCATFLIIKDNNP